MHDHRPSFTAALVSFGRGISRPEMAIDPFAVDLCPFPFRPLLKAYGATGELESLRSIYRVAGLGLMDHMSLRTSAIDRGVGGALADGAQQVVLLGAGLDARARRLPALANHTVFEVDHPATQGYKRKKMGEHEGLRYVAVNFERDDLGERLIEAGFDAGRTTVWIWEGVIMYLVPTAVEATLKQLQSLSAPGSRLLASYLVPRPFPFGTAGALVAGRAFEALGEGVRAGYEPSDLNALLGRHDFSVMADSNNVDWAESAGVSAWQATLWRGERLVVARRN